MYDNVIIAKTTSENKDFISLVNDLDSSLWKKYPELKSILPQYLFKKSSYKSPRS